MTDVDEVKVQISLYVDRTVKEEMEDFLFEKKIRKFQDGYREIMRLGFQEFKKRGGKIEQGKI